MGDLICLENIKKEIDMTLQTNRKDFTSSNATSLSDGTSPAPSTTSSYSSSQDNTINSNDDINKLNCIDKCECGSSTCQNNSSRCKKEEQHAISPANGFTVDEHLYVEQHLAGSSVLVDEYPQKNYLCNVRNCRFSNVKMATKDSTFLNDRCLEIALKIEEKRSRTDCTYFKTVQKDITPPMRKIVAEWMMEVCAEEKCQDEVVLLALNYMDRFLSEESIRKTHLQILGAACLLLASKLREPTCQALSAELLVFYTDNSIYKDDLIKWELIVLSRLGWDMSSITPLDFLELLLIRLPIRCTKYIDLNVKKVRKHAQAFISLAAKECNFSKYSASTIAASSIVAALSGLNLQFRSGQNLRYLLSILTDLTSIEQDFLYDCMLKMEKTFDEHSRNLQPPVEAMEHSHSQQQVSLTTVWKPLHQNNFLYDQNSNSTHSKNRNQQYDNSDKTVQVLQYSI